MACLGELPGDLLTGDRVFLRDRFTCLQIIGQPRTALVNDAVFPEDDPVPEIFRVSLESLPLGSFLPESLPGCARTCRDSLLVRADQDIVVFR